MKFRAIYQKFIDKLLHHGTKRRYFYELGLTSIKIIVKDGWRSFWFRAVAKINLRPILGKADSYHQWIINNEPQTKQLEQFRKEYQSWNLQPKISIITPVWNTDKKWLDLAIQSVLDQVYENWELCLVDDGSKKPYIKQLLKGYQQKDKRIKIEFLNENAGIADASNKALSLATGEFVGFLDHDDELRPHALYDVVKLLNNDANLDLIYSDEDKVDIKGKRSDAFFKPDWSPDLFMSFNYICHFTVIRKTLLVKVGGFRRGFEGSQDYDLFLRVIENTNRIAHIPKPLYSWRIIPSSTAASSYAKPYAHLTGMKALRESFSRRMIEGDVVAGYTSCYYHVRYKIINKPLVSIIIPTKNSVEKLQRCITSIETKTTYNNYEIIVIDNDSQEHDAIEYIKKLKHKVINYKSEFNFSGMNNLGVKNAIGEHIVFLNNDTEIIEPGWLEAMLEHSQRTEVGMVGALLLYPPDSPYGHRIQHAGVILGMGIAGHAFKMLPDKKPSYFCLAQVIRNCSAVTAACAMMKKSLFVEVGGMDETLPVAYNDVDLCLRLRRMGYLIIYTPYSVLYHYEGGTRGKVHPPDDETNTLARWSTVISEGDPYYNRNLTLLKEDYSIVSRNAAILALAVLLEVYDTRPDLQKRYSEVKKGEYQRLVDWAINYGLTIDRNRPVLRPHGSWYVEHSSNETKPFAAIVELYNLSPVLQKDFPEVLQGNYNRLLAWARDVINSHDSKNNVAFKKLLPYKSWYEKRL